MKKRRSRGFTLIELLVVIAIIGLLAAMVGASVSSARAKGRDSRRMADIKSVQSALDMYYLKIASYPESCNGLRVAGDANWGSSTLGYTHSCPNSTEPWIKNLIPDYIQFLPDDPAPSNATPVRTYLYSSDGTDYKLMARGMETQGGLTAALNDGGITTGDRATDYERFSGGAQSW